MANQTVTTGTPTTPINYDDSSISGLLNGETITINGGAVRVDSDVRWNQQNAVLGAVSISSSLGGSFVIDGSQVWEVPFSASTGNVPTQGNLGTNGVTGGTSGATGELLRVWATGSLEPATAGGAMPATGFIKLRSKTGNFQTGEIITLPSGATITASSAGKRSWVHVAAREGTSLTIPRLGNCSITGDWYDLDVTNGLDDQTVQFPVADECPALQVETAPSSGVYEWWINAGKKWVGHVQAQTQTVNGLVETVNIATRPAYNDPAGFLHTARQIRETATTAVHVTGSSHAATAVEAGIYKLRTYVKKDTRRYAFAQITTGVANADRYGVIIDFDAAGAVVATPTVGSPLNTSNTVTALSGGWYLIELTINVVSATTSTLSGFVGPSNSAAPTLVNGQPSYAGSTTEGMWYTELQLVAPSSTQYVNSTDERGKYFFSSPQTGIITFAQRTGLTAGFKPVSGCKIRIPNVILSNAPAIDYTINSVQTPGGSPGRYGFVTSSAGAVNISHAVMNWYQSIGSAFTVNIQNSALTAWNSIGAASTQVYSNLGIGLTRDHTSAGFLSLSSAQSGITLTDIRQVRDQIGSAVITLSSCSNITATRVKVEAFGFNQGRISRFNTTGNGFFVLNCDDLVLDDCAVIGTGILFSSTTNFQILNTKYAERITGQTEALDGGTAINISTACFDGLIDGFSLVPGLVNVHPYSQIVQIATNCNRIETRNIGTPTAPLNGGSANQMRNAIRFAGTVFNSTARRIYTENLGTAAVAHNATNQNIRLYNVWGDGSDALTSVTGFNVLAQGCRWSNNNEVRSAVYGVHWEDAFTGTTSGRITIFGNEPLPSTASQCSTSFGVNAGFTSAGNAAMPNVDDTITWTMPYYALGHTGIAQFSYGASATETWQFTGTNAQNFEFEYQIDTGSGFSAWKWMLDIARRLSGGASGTNTVTINSADVAAMTRKPQVGDYVSTQNGRIPAGTTITGISGAGNNVLTLSNNFTVTLANGELLFFFKDIALETISPTTGYKLKVKARVNLANVNNLFSFLRIPFDTNSTAQQIQYPLPTTQNTAQVTNIITGSRIRVYNQTTATEIANEIITGTEWVYNYDEGTDFTDGDIINVRLAYCDSTEAYLDYENIAVAGSNGWTLLANQLEDTIYNDNAIDGTIITEFIFDYPNVQVDINDPDGSTSIDRLYAWFANERTTENGIRILNNGIIAEDSANYKIITSKINLKLDNLASTGIIFIGDIRLYRDDGQAPVVSSTTGGGSITLYAGKVYAFETGTSGLTPEESASLTGIKKNTDLIPATL